MEQITTAQATAERPEQGASGSGPSQRWGIIYCPKQGVHRSQKRWERIRDILTKHHVDYDFVQSERISSVTRLTKMLVGNGYKTIIIVGGDSALNRALNGLLEMPDEARQQVALGIIPNGRGNDFATYWGFTEENDEQSIQWLINRRLRRIDVGYINYRTYDKGETATRYFINCVNVGLVANIMKIKYKARRIFALTGLTYFASMLALLFQRMEVRMRLKVNEEHVEQKVMTVCIGNGHSYGQTPSAVPYNGMLDVTVVSHPEIARLFEGMVMLFTGQFLNHKNVKAYRTARPIRFEETQGATVSTDGRVLEAIAPPFEIGLKHEHINFIIPT